MQKMTRTLIAAALGVMAVSAMADKNGYVSDSRAAVVKNNFGECWRSGFWNKDLAVEECDADLMPKKVEPPKPEVKPEPPKPEVKPEPPKKKPEALTLNASSLFEFNKADLKDEGKEALGAVAKVLLERKYDPAKTRIEVTGHTDRIGSQEHNAKLSQARADTTRSFLVEKGIPDGMITATGKGFAEPITKPEDCKKVAKNRSKLIACYAPDRRVEVGIYATVEAQ
ncbi:OmpA family protein [Chitinimonas sp.]|uniref:OmpA family protein n=1 Tax=Chitinimonas sp. TaxID=1934313 RepID=UPI0035B22883